MKTYKLKKMKIFAVAASMTLVGLAHAAGDGDASVATVPVAPPFVSARDAGVQFPAGTTLSEADKKILSQITVEQFKAVVAGQDLATIKTRDGSVIGVPAIEGPATTALGAINDNLVFTPISPCRVIDTGVAGGSFSTNEIRSYTLGGKSNFTSYGGSNGDCTLPGSEGFFLFNEKVRAWSINIVAAAPVNNGNLVVWPTNLVEPTASTLNFQKLTPNLNIANGVIVQNCTDFGSIGIGGPGNPLCPSGDLSIKANITSGVRVVMDITGYFTRATNESVKSRVVEVTTTSATALAQNTCTAVTQCGRTATSLFGDTPAGRYVVSGNANFFVGASAGNPRLSLTTNSNSTCNNVHSSSAVARNSGTGSLANIQVQGMYPVAADTAITIFMNAETLGSTGHVNSSSQVCTFIPN